MSGTQRLPRAPERAKDVQEQPPDRSTPAPPSRRTSPWERTPPSAPTRPPTNLATPPEPQNGAATAAKPRAAAQQIRAKPTALSLLIKVPGVRLTTCASAASDPRALHQPTFRHPPPTGGDTSIPPSSACRLHARVRQRRPGALGPDSRDSPSRTPCGGVWHRRRRDQIGVQVSKLLVGKVAEPSSRHPAHQRQFTVAERLPPAHQARKRLERVARGDS